MGVGTAIDRVIGVLVPGWGAGRARARLRAETFRQQRTYLSTYDAAAKTRNTADWDERNNSADNIIIADYATLLARARAAARDDWAGASIVDGYKRHVVGTGITARANARDPVSGAALLAFNRTLDALWLRWVRKPRFCDVERRKTLLGIQGLAASELVGVGQSFCALRYLPEPGMVGLKLQMFEPEQLDDTKSRNPDTKFDIKGGIEVDSYGAPAGYWFFTAGHPYEAGGAASERIDAASMVHLMRQDRVRQTHGVTRLAPVLRDLWHMKMFEEYTLLRARFEACGGATIERVPGASPQEMLGVLTGNAEDAADTDLNKQLTFEPNMLWPLPVGAKAVFHDPKTPGGQFEPYTRQQVKKIAAGAGLDYPTVSRDFAGNSFAGQRQGMLETWAETDPEQLRMTDVMLQPIREMFITFAVLERRVAAPNWHASPEWRAAYMETDWQPPAKPWIDPANQAAAAKIALEQRLTTHRKILNELGESWQEVFQQIADEELEAKVRGITLPSSTGNQKVAPQEPRPDRAFTPDEVG